MSFRKPVYHGGESYSQCFFQTRTMNPLYASALLPADVTNLPPAWAAVPVGAGPSYRHGDQAPPPQNAVPRAALLFCPFECQEHPVPATEFRKLTGALRTEDVTVSSSRVTVWSQHSKLPSQNVGPKTAEALGASRSLRRLKKQTGSSPGPDQDRRPRHQCDRPFRFKLCAQGSSDEIRP